MGLKSAFKKVGRGIGIGAKGAWKGFTAFDDVMDKIPFAENLVMAIPIVGPALSFAMQKVDLAQEMFPGEGEGGRRREWAIAQLRKDLRKAGLDEAYSNEIVGLAFLATRGQAGVTEDVAGVPSELGTGSAEAGVPNTPLPPAAVPDAPQGDSPGQTHQASGTARPDVSKKKTAKRKPR